VKKNNTKKSPV